MEGMAEFYSRQLSQNIRRGMAYNAEHALYNGHKVWGYGVDDEKRYVADDAVAPFVIDMFTRYADGEAMQPICDDFNARGLRTTRGALFGVKTMNKLLKNRAYIGEYTHGGVTVEGGMPQIVDEELFDRAQRWLAENKRNGSRRRVSAQAEDAPLATGLRASSSAASAEAPCRASRARARPGRSTITTTARSRGPRGARRGQSARNGLRER